MVTRFEGIFSLDFIGFGMCVNDGFVGVYGFLASRRYLRDCCQLLVL